jgi:DNA-binding transcriptional MerR regulator
MLLPKTLHVERAMRTKQKSKEMLFGTKQVAEFLGVLEWRVKNFSEGEAYRLPPSQKVGTGRGSRRLYNLNDILRLAIANELVNYGFSPDEVGRAVREIPESTLMFWPAEVRLVNSKESLDSLPILVCLRGELGWRVRKAREVESLVSQTLAYEGSRSGIFILNFPRVLKKVLDRMTTWRERATAEEHLKKRGEV